MVLKRTVCTQNVKNKCVLSDVETETSKNCSYSETTKRCRNINTTTKKNKNMSVSAKIPKAKPSKQAKTAKASKKETFVYMNVKLYHGKQYTGTDIKCKLEKDAVAFVKRYITSKSPDVFTKRNDTAKENYDNILPNDDSEIIDFLLSDILELSTHNARDQRSTDTIIAYDIKRVICMDPFLSNIIKLNCKLINLWPNSQNPSYKTFKK